MSTYYVNNKKKACAYIGIESLSYEIEETVSEKKLLELIEELKDALDCNLYFFEKQVRLPAMYGILVATIIILIAVYILLNQLQNKRSR